jgi:adenine-specific DNA-methyltransferase
MQKMTPSDGQSMNVVDENIAVLKKAFPEAFTEDGIDFEVLRQLLGDNVAEGEEKYGLNWFGKKKARQIALSPSMGTLIPCPEESVDWDTTQNLFIEGDNLEVLKLLQRSYSGKIKMIYIDPPYNTGNDFVYEDNYKDSIKNYKTITGQLDGEGLSRSSNSESSGRYHTNWLNMMYPRLKLARNLLKDDGVIFISIDDNEVANLRKMCDEIFGEENLLGELIWHLSSGPQAGHFTRSNEVLIAFAKNKNLLDYFQDKSGGTIKHGALKKISTANPASEITFKKGSIKFEGDDAEFPDELGGSEKQYITDGRLRFKDGVLAEDVTIKAGWAMKNQVLSWLKGEDTFDSKGQRVIRFYFNPQGILFYEKERGTAHPKTVIPASEVGGTKAGGDQVSELLGSKVMSFPKPIGLIQFLANHVTASDDLILDFFAGSGTTAHATMQLNAEDAGNRKFIVVQLPEPCDEKTEAFKAGYKTIAELSKERIRRAALKIMEENPEHEGDLGFKVFKLDSSNIVAWNPDKTDLEQTLLGYTEHLAPGRSEQDVLYELLLKRGVELTAPIEKKEIAGKKVYSIGFGVLFACLDKKIQRDQIEELAHGIIDWHKELDPISDTQVVFRDSAFENDVTKANMTAILEQSGIKHVRSL